MVTIVRLAQACTSAELVVWQTVIWKGQTDGQVWNNLLTEEHSLLHSQFAEGLSLKVKNTFAFLVFTVQFKAFVHFVSLP